MAKGSRSSKGGKKGKSSLTSAAARRLTNRASSAGSDVPF